MASQRALLILQLLGTLLILALIPNNAVKVALMLPMWWISFRGLNRKELISFIIINFIFVVNDIGAIQNGFFSFTHPDILGLPAWEFFMWGFYLLHTYRFFPPRIPRVLDFKLVFLAIAFAASFSVFSDRQHILIATSLILLTTIYFFHALDDLFYCIYLMAVGVAFEAVGIYFNLWSYPKENFQSAMIQFVIMWGAIGIYFRHILCWWLVKAEKKPRPFVQYEGNDGPRLQEQLREAMQLKSEGLMNEALHLFRKIEASGAPTSSLLAYDFYKNYSQVVLYFGNLRQAVELAREALNFVPNSNENARIHLHLCRIYRMMILMKNARMELIKAFESLGLELPLNSVFQAIAALLKCAWQSLRMKISPKFLETIPRDRREIMVELYEEAGLSAYYFRDYYALAQSSLLSRGLAFSLGPSMGLLNWVGGSACVWVLLGFNRYSRILLNHSVRIAQELGTKEAEGKSQIWQAIYFDYARQPLLAGEHFANVIEKFRPYIGPFDYRLSVVTYSCNNLLRGHFKKSYEIVRNMSELEDSSIRYFSAGRAYYDWYVLGSLGFLGYHGEAQRLIENSQVIFFRVDEERWQISQYLGELLVYLYSLPDKNLNLIEECIRRFESLNLAPKETFLEATQFWVAKAYLSIELFHSGHWKNLQVQKSLKQLKSCIAHPSVQAHIEILKLKYQLIVEKDLDIKKEFLDRCESLAQQSDHRWVQYEILKIRQYLAKSDSEKTESRKNLLSFLEDNQWKGILAHA